MDFFKSESLWFGDEHFLRKNGIPVYNFIQGKGDMVLVNRGFVYWIKSVGLTINSGWNLFGNDFEQIPIMLDKYEMNKENEVENIINIKTFSYDLTMTMVAFSKNVSSDKNLSHLEKLIKTVQKFHEDEEKIKNDAIVRNDKTIKKMKIITNNSITNV